MTRAIARTPLPARPPAPCGVGQRGRVGSTGSVGVSAWDMSASSGPRSPRSLVRDVLGSHAPLARRAPARPTRASRPQCAGRASRSGSVVRASPRAALTWLWLRKSACAEVGSAEVGVAQVGAEQVGATQVEVAQVGADQHARRGGRRRAGRRSRRSCPARSRPRQVGAAAEPRAGRLEGGAHAVVQVVEVEVEQLVRGGSGQADDLGRRASAAAGSGLRRPTSVRCASISWSSRITESTAAISPRLSVLAPRDAAVRHLRDLLARAEAVERHAAGPAVLAQGGVDAAPVVVGEVRARRTAGLVHAEAGHRAERQQHAAQGEALLAVRDERRRLRDGHPAIVAVARNSPELRGIDSTSGSLHP